MKAYFDLHGLRDRPVGLWLSTAHDFFSVRRVDYISKELELEYAKMGMVLEVPEQAVATIDGESFKPWLTQTIDELTRRGNGWLPTQAHSSTYYDTGLAGFIMTVKKEAIRGPGNVSDSDPSLPSDIKWVRVRNEITGGGENVGWMPRVIAIALAILASGCVVFVTVRWLWRRAWFPFAYRNRALDSSSVGTPCHQPPVAGDEKDRVSE